MFIRRKAALFQRPLPELLEKIVSAFICADDQFEAVVNGWYRYMQYAKRTPEELQAMADTLKRENIRSVNWRYNEHTKFKSCKFVAQPKDSKPAYSIEQIIQWLLCIEYQSCERDDYESSKACALLSKMLSDLWYLVRNKRVFDGLHFTLPY
jgi:hypothetical protein